MLLEWGRSGGGIFHWLATFLTNIVGPPDWSQSQLFTPFHHICLTCAYLSLLLAQNKSWLTTLHSKLVSFYPGSCYLLCLMGWTLHQHLLLNLLSLLTSQHINMPKSILKHRSSTWKVLFTFHLFPAPSLTLSFFTKSLIVPQTFAYRIEECLRNSLCGSSLRDRWALPFIV